MLIAGTRQRMAHDGVRERSAYNLIVLGLIAATLFFNFGLCFINNKVMAVGEAHVVLAEAMIMAATWGVLLMSRRPLDLCWVCFAIAIV